MKIAIPLFGKRVSPHYSTAPELFVILTHGNKVYSTTILNLSKLSLTEKRRKLITLGIETIICGGIDEATREWLRQKDIRVIENVMGEAMEALSDFLSSEMEKEDISSKKQIRKEGKRNGR